MPIELKHPKKGIINIKNDDQKCFLLCHVRHINRLKEHLERIEKLDREIACNLNYDRIEEKDFKKILVQNNDDRSPYVYIKDFNIFMFYKTKKKTKKKFCKSCTVNNFYKTILL